MKTVAIIVPAYNEEACLERLHAELDAALRDEPYRFRILIVDDGSTDGTPRICRELKTRDPRVGYLRLSRNFGHQAALTAGLDASAGADAAITLDADLEQPPAAIPEFLRAWERGAQIVSGVRREGGELGLFKRLSSVLFYKLFNRFSEAPTAPHSPDFRLLDRAAVQAVCQVREQSRFLRGIYAWAGFEQNVVEYEPGQRVGGEPKYSTRKSSSLALSAVLSFSRTPLRLATYVGVLVSILAFVYGLYAIAQSVIFEVALPGWTSLAVLISFLSGIQLLTIGVLGEYLGQVLDEVKRRPLYLIAEQSLPEDEAGE